MTAPRVLPAPHITEAAFTDQLIELAHIFGWRVSHFRPAMTAHGWRTAVSGDGKGWPDLLAVRGNRMIAAELKVGRNKATPEQLAWLAALKAAGAECFIWTPADWDEITGELR